MINDFFFPGFKGGGPIQSLANLIVALEGEYNFRVLCSAFDLGESKPYNHITLNQWNTVHLPGSTRSIEVYYAAGGPSVRKMMQIMREARPDCIYLNIIYSFRFFLLPLVIKRMIVPAARIVVCPRGLLQRGALVLKPGKKKMYLRLLRHSTLLKDAVWHATNDEEATDIRQNLRLTGRVVEAPNIPRAPLPDITIPAKEVNSLRLVYLSLITEKKNLLGLLKLLDSLELPIALDIYGPVKDHNYWKECQPLIERLSPRVQYKGEVQPQDVQSVISQYHAFALLTTGENFGHALFEALGAGRPLITSHRTPWNNLHEQSAGVNIDIDNQQDGTSKLLFMAAMSQDEYRGYCLGASKLARKFFSQLNASAVYHPLFDQ